MTTRWQAVRRLFESAQDLPKRQRQDWVKSQVGDDVILGEEVCRLLFAEDEAGDFLIEPAVPALFGQKQQGENEAVLAEGDRIGAYRVLQRIGEGGVSVVYLAERCDGVFEQKVGIKVIKRGMDTASVIARFHSERQILAALDHPFIARILDGGTTLDGLPYFVMEFVEGEILTEYLRHRRLEPREKLELFVRVSSAVAYAHRRQVIHRDLKPANIVVDASGNPKLLDFGLAKVLTQPGEDHVTLAAERMLTPAYASPEQLKGEPLTTASDVYSLGVLLHEMLLGARPRKDGDSALPSADRDSPRDIRHIVRMALRPEPERRYRSADQLREDVERHLMGLPIEARHGRAGYRMRRFIARHKMGLAASLTVLLSVAISAAVVLWQRQIARLEHTRAERRYRELRQLANLMVVEFDDAILDMPGAPPVRKALVSNALGSLIALEPESAGDPVLQREIARAYVRLGDVQRQSYGLSPGDTDGALENFDRARKIMEGLIGQFGASPTDSHTLAQCHHRTALTLRQMGDWRGDLEHAHAAVEIHREIVRLQDGSPAARTALADALQTLGVAWSKTGNVTATLQTFEAVAALRQELYDRDRSDEEARADLSRALRNLGLGHEMAGDIEAALRVYQMALEHVDALLESNPASVHLRSDLMRNVQQIGNSLCTLGRVSDGLDELREAVDLGCALQRVDPNNAGIRRRLVQAYRDLGLALINAGASADAVAILTQAADLLSPWAGVDQANAQVQVLLAQVAAALGQANEPTDPNDIRPERWNAALTQYRRSQTVWQKLQADGRLAPVYVHELTRLNDAVRRCEPFAIGL